MLQRNKTNTMKFPFIINKKRRSLISCSECRRKKLKCDESKPSCARCLKGGKCCEYTKASEVKKVRKVRKGYDENVSIFSAIGGIQQQLEDEVNNNKMAISNIIDFPILTTPITSNLVDFPFDIDNWTPNKIEELKDGELDNTQLFEAIDDYDDDIEGLEEVRDTIRPYNTNLDVDMEFQALTIISTSENMKDMFNRYNRCYSLILPLAFTNKSIMFTFAGWILSLNQNMHAEKFLSESIKVFDYLESRAVLDPKNNSDDITGIIVSQTCHAILASSRGDYTTWRKMFDRTHNTLKSIGINESIALMENNPAICWVLAWFFYQDIFKMGKTSTTELSSPLFPKHIYKKIIDITIHSRMEAVNNYSVMCCGPLTKCCADLCIITGEIKTLYDLFTVKLEELNSYNKTYIEPILEKEYTIKEKTFEFLSSETYKKYDSMKKHFYSWFGMKAGVLEAKLSETLPDLNLEGYNPEQIDKLRKFHQLLKLSMRIFLKVKILRCSISSFEVKILCKEILTGIQSLVSWELNNCLLFPFIIAGSCIYETADRLMLEMLYQDLKKYITSGNLNRAWEIIQKIWNSYSTKETHGDSNDILSIIDCDVCVF